MFDQYILNNGSFLTETSQHGRYSVEVNYRTSLEEVIENFAKITLGYVSSAMKRSGYHCKNILDKKPFRILIGSRAWDDGEWVAVLVFYSKKNQFYICEGTFNKGKKTVSVHKNHAIDLTRAADLTKEIKTVLDKLENLEPIRLPDLKPLPRSAGRKKKFKIKKPY